MAGWKAGQASSLALGLRPSVVALAGVAVFGGGLCLFTAASLMGAGPRALCGTQCAAREQASVLEKPRLADGDFAHARALGREQLAVSPFDASARLRLAILESRQGGAGSATALRSLARSYVFAPVDARIARWRIVFSFEHWSDLDVKLRDAAIAEVTTLYSAPQNRSALQSLTQQIKDPTGGIAYLLLVEGLEDAARRETGRETLKATPRIKLQRAAIAGS